MKIFITGATGFIGSHVVKQALAAGHTVLALRRSPRSFLRIPLERQPQWLERSIRQLTAEDIKGFDVLVHLAATGVSPRVATWQELSEVNVNGTIHICSLAKQLQSSLVIAGSFAEYGLSGLRYERIPPSAPLEPTFPYAASKAAACVICASFARSERIPISYLRVFNAFGEGQHESNLWPSMRKAAIEGRDYPITAGEQIRDFIPVEDVAKAFIREAEGQQNSLDHMIVRNIGSGNPQSIRKFCEHWWEKWHAKGRLLIGALPYRDGEVMRYVPEV
jgi:UDP-glucose 4-epimerase